MRKLGGGEDREMVMGKMRDEDVSIAPIN